MKDKDDGQHEQAPGEFCLEDGHETDEDEGDDQVVEITGDDIGERKDDLRDVDPPDEGLIVDDRARGDCDCLLDHRIGDQPGEEKDRVVWDRKAEDFGKDKGQNDKVEEGIEDGPQEAEDGSPVAQLELPDDQIPEQLPKLKDFPDVVFHPRYFNRLRKLGTE